MAAQRLAAELSPCQQAQGGVFCFFGRLHLQRQCGQERCHRPIVFALKGVGAQCQSLRGYGFPLLVRLVVLVAGE